MPLGSLVESPNPHHLSRDQLFALKITSLVGGSLSVASVLVASYWFVRMRRSFRHEYYVLPSFTLGISDESC